METKSDNEIIAMFDDRMSYHVPENTKYEPYWKRYRDSSKEDIIQEFRANGLKYHTSWDWLMPVWYKFKSLIFPDYKQSEHYGQYKQIIKHAIINDGIETACKELVEGIKWYNQQPK